RGGGRGRVFPVPGGTARLPALPPAGGGTVDAARLRSARSGGEGEPGGAGARVYRAGPECRAVDEPGGLSRPEEAGRPRLRELHVTALHGLVRATRTALPDL